MSGIKGAAERTPTQEPERDDAEDLVRAYYQIHREEFYDIDHCRAYLIRYGYNRRMTLERFVPRAAKAGAKAGPKAAKAAAKAAKAKAPPKKKVDS